MDAAEFAARMQRGNPCGLPPLVYGRHAAGAACTAGTAGTPAASREYLYFQAELPPGLLADCDLAAPPFAPPTVPQDPNFGGLMFQLRVEDAKRRLGGAGRLVPSAGGEGAG